MGEWGPRVSFWTLHDGTKDNAKQEERLRVQMQEEAEVWGTQRGMVMRGQLMRDGESSSLGPAVLQPLAPAAAPGTPGCSSYTQVLGVI